MLQRVVHSLTLSLCTDTAGQSGSDSGMFAGTGTWITLLSSLAVAGCLRPQSQGCGIAFHRCIVHASGAAMHS